MVELERCLPLKPGFIARAVTWRTWPGRRFQNKPCIVEPVKRVTALMEWTRKCVSELATMVCEVVMNAALWLGLGKARMRPAAQSVKAQPAAALPLSDDVGVTVLQVPVQLKKFRC